MNMKLRLIVMNFLEFAAWGAYLTSMGAYLARVGLGTDIGNYYAVQGIVSIFMPAIMGIIADRWVQAQRLLSFCHFMSAVFMGLAAWIGLQAGGGEVNGTALFWFYSLSVAFYMPTLALSNSVSYTALDHAGLDTVKAFPPIRVFGTIGFICAMLFVDFSGFQNTPYQFLVSAVLSICLALYALTLPSCPVGRDSGKQSVLEAMGLKAFTLFRDRKMAFFFIFSFMLGVSLQITNGYANPYIQSFGAYEGFEGLFFVKHSNLLISLSQLSETLCILLIPFFLKRFGIKIVMLISMLAWVGRFGFFGLGNPGTGVWLFILSCIVYGVAFDFFNVSGSLFVDKETDMSIRSSAQGLFMVMTNGLGATFGSLGAKEVINYFVFTNPADSTFMSLEGWRTSWFIFAGYALVVAIAFAILFEYKHVREE
ncbi:MAG: MFS transporter [Bacteroidales bacterium]|jgi:NHS family xanthosine MFS transporter|nr:MFS transporter [Bacteroidales bacterium]MBO7378233.1 MFS transporter [Bacteroidales bacterium]MBP5213726.1 MFS transporter [Bacteroidales bacterium]MBP5763571.1 MFS transporter [Bacteroidales bacterium]